MLNYHLQQLFALPQNDSVPCWSGCTWNTVSSFGCHYSRRIWIDLESKEGPLGKAELVLFSLEKRRLRRHHITVFQCFKGGYTEDWGSLLRRSDWRRQGRNTASCTGHFNARKKCSTVNTTICWSNLPRDVVECSLLDVFMMQVDKVLHNLIWLPFPMKIESDILLRSLQTLATVWNDKPTLLVFIFLSSGIHELNSYSLF